MPSSTTTAAGVSVPGTSAISDIGSPSAQLPVQSTGIDKKASVKRLSKVETKRLRKEQRAKQVISTLHMIIVLYIIIPVGSTNEEET